MKIVFLGTHGQYNIGDELLLETFLRQLGEEHYYAVNSYDPDFTLQNIPKQFHVEAFHTTNELFRFIGYIFSCDLIFFGGGSIIKELYASVGRNRFGTLGMIFSTVTFAKTILRKRVVMSNIGIGPIKSRRGHFLARWIIQQVDYLSVRDKNSYDICMRLGIPTSKVKRIYDAVFATPPDVFLPNHKTFSPSGETHIALNLNFDIENRAAWESFLQSLAGALNMLKQNQKVIIHALPMQSRFKKNDDLTVLKNFHERIPEIEMIFSEPQSAQEVAAIIDQCDIVLAERLHTLVISSILGKPFYGLMYDIKVQELIDYLGMARYAININQPFESATLYQGLLELLKDRSEVATHLLERSSALQQELSTYFADLRSKYLS